MTEAEWAVCQDPEKMLDYLSGRGSDRKLRLFGCGCCRRVWGAIPSDRNREAVMAVERFPETPPTEEYPEGWSDHPVLGEALSASSTIESVPLYAKLATSGSVEDQVEFQSMLAKLVASCNVEYQHMLAQPPYDYLTMPTFEPAYWAVKSLGRTYYKRTPLDYAKLVARYAAESAAAAGRERAEEEEAQAGLLRCIFGNPFRPVALDRSWKTPTALAIAQAAYDDRIVPAGHLDAAHLAILADALEDAGCTNAELLGHLRGPGPHVRGCWALDAILGKS
jgi:hypothetical protein